MKRVVCIGDSITYGQLLGEPDKAWPQLIQGYKVTAAGVPGETTRQALERFPQVVQREQPEITIIQYGHNDANRWQTDCGLHRVSPDAFAANLREMILRCQRFASLPLLCSLTPSSKSDQHAHDTAYYNTIIREVAATSQTMLIDVWPHFSGSDEQLFLDGLHLNETGHRLYADVVQRVLDAWR